MRLSQYPLFWPTCCYAIGVFLESKFFLFGLPEWLWLVVFLWLLLIAANFKNPSFGILICIGFFMLGLGISRIQKPDTLSDFPLETKYHVGVFEVIKPPIKTKFNSRFAARAITINHQPIGDKVLVVLDSTPENVNLIPGHRIQIVGQLQNIEAPSLPYQFDFKKYMAHRGIKKQFQARSKIRIINADQRNSIRGIAHLLRQKVSSKINDLGFKKDNLAILKAMVLGSKNEVSEDLLADYRHSGAAHLLAVSGLHVGIVCYLLNLFLGWLRSKWIHFIGICILLWGYAVLTGLSPSVVRAVTMFCILQVAWSLKQSQLLFQGVLLSFLLLLIVNPMFLFDVGFQLSYTAVFGIIWLYPKLLSFWKPQLKIIAYFWKLFIIGLTAQISILPLSLYYFHQFPSLFFVTNLLVVPCMGLVIGLGILTLIGALLNIVPNFWVEFYDQLLGVLNAVVRFVADQEAFLIQDLYISWWEALALGAIVWAFGWCLENWIWKRLLIFLSAVSLLLLLFQLRLEQLNQTSRGIIFHQPTKSIVAEQNGRYWQIFGDSTQVNKSKIVQQWAKGARMKNPSYKPKKFVFEWNQIRLIIVDSLGVYEIPDFKPTHVLLTQNTPVHLDRLLNTLGSPNIIADGSSYNTTKKRWKKTCDQRKIPFLDTAKKGMISFDFIP